MNACFTENYSSSVKIIAIYNLNNCLHSLKQPNSNADLHVYFVCTKIYLSQYFTVFKKCGEKVEFRSVEASTGCLYTSVSMFILGRRINLS